MKDAKLMSSHDNGDNHVVVLVKGIVEGETWVLAQKEFKAEVFDKVQLELNQFGLHIYNANIKQLVDIKGKEYFSFLCKKIQQGAANQAKVDVAKTKYEGDTGALGREGQTLMNAARVNADTAMYTKSQSGAAMQQGIKIDTEIKVLYLEQGNDLNNSNTISNQRKLCTMLCQPKTRLIIKDLGCGTCDL